MHIVGGTYREVCLEPQWDELYGSGLRAASALSELDENLKFTTYANEDNDIPLLVAKSKTLNFCIDKVIPRPNQLTFSYFHPLSTPYIYPQNVTHIPCIEVKDENILLFGMIEQNAVAYGKRVVYDPQSPIKPTLFHENGSTAESLALVLNKREAKILGEEDNIDLATKKLFKLTEADAIIIKNGPCGCDVFSNEGCSKHFPTLETKNVWLIGSGDIFSATFAFFWTENNDSLFNAVEKAIKATAMYSQTFSAKLPFQYKDIIEFSASELISKSQKTKMIYLASPFFNLSERWFIEEARCYLNSDNIKVFSPYHDVGRGNAEEIYQPDIDAIKDCDVMFANLCGLDCGTIYEISYAVSLQKPVIVFSQNNREEDLKMITGGGCKVYDDFSTAIYKTIWEALKA